jgi:hypothetical protein
LGVGLTPTPNPTIKQTHPRSHITQKQQQQQQILSHRNFELASAICQKFGKQDSHLAHEVLPPWGGNQKNLQ